MEYRTFLHGYEAVASLRENEVETILYVQVIHSEQVKNDLMDGVITEEHLSYSQKRPRSWSYEEMMEDYSDLMGVDYFIPEA